MTADYGRERPERPVAPAGTTEQDREMREIHSADEVKAHIGRLVEEIFSDFGTESFLMVVIEKGGRRLAAHLVEGLRERGAKPEMLYLRAWRTEGTTLGDPKLSLVETKVFSGRNVLVVDDIVDEGRTMEVVLDRIQEGGPESVRTAVLVSKLEHRKVDVPLHYVGFELTDGWVVGFGMDLDDAYRDLDHLAIVEAE